MKDSIISPQYHLNKNELTLTVKKSPWLVRAMLFFFAFALFIAPLGGILYSMSVPNGFRLNYLIVLFLFGILGFYLLRNALWNTYGKEIIVFSKQTIVYTADYGWFKDGQKQIEKNPNLEFGIERIGYEDDNMGVLQIGIEKPSIDCVTKMPISELEELIDILNQNILAK